MMKREGWGERLAAERGGALGSMILLILAGVILYYSWIGWNAQGRPVPIDIDVHTESADSVVERIN